MDYNTLWNSYQRALKRIEVLEKQLGKFKDKSLISKKSRLKKKEEVDGFSNK